MLAGGWRRWCENTNSQRESCGRVSRRSKKHLSALPQPEFYDEICIKEQRHGQAMNQ